MILIIQFLYILLVLLKHYKHPYWIYKQRKNDASILDGSTFKYQIACIYGCLIE